MKRLAYILTIVILIICCNKNTIANDDYFLPDSISFEDDFITDSAETDVEEICIFSIEQYPRFGNSYKDISKYITENTEYPQSAIDDGIEGRVFVQFVVNEDGSVTNAEVLRGLRSDFDEECVRVLENMPDWGKYLSFLM